MPDQYDQLAPDAVATTLRSLPRRIGGAFGQVTERPASEYAETIGAAGRSPVDVVSDLGRSLALLDRALEQTLLHDDATVHEGVVNRDARSWPERLGSLTDARELTDDAVTTMADRIDSVPAADWSRTVGVAGGGEIDAMSIAQEAARTAITSLRELEALVVELN